MKKVLFCLLIVLGMILPQNSIGQNKYDGTTLVSKATFLGKSDPLRDIINKVPTIDLDKVRNRKADHPKKFFPNFKNKTPTIAVNKDALPNGVDPVWQSSGRNTTFVVDPIVDMDGIGSSNSNATPPDPSGAIGKNYFIQMVNATLFQVFNKDGSAASGITNMSAFWNQFGRNSGGDPIVLYDQLAERWVFTEFPNNQDFLLVAVSATDDPFGEWNAYEFQTPSFPDYPKYGIFENAYVVTTNEGGDIPVYCLDRESLLDGADDVDVVRVTVPRIQNGPSFQVITPLNVDGNLVTPEGNPMIIRMNDDAWGAAAQDQIELWSIDLDWTDPDAATISKTSEIITAPFDSYPCSQETGGFACVPQPNGQGTDALVEVIMNQCHYRNFESHESIVLNFIVDASGDNLSGIRWMELRRVNCETWEVFQEGTYAPDDEHRYMGGIAMDAFGNIGMGYNFSSSSNFPSLAFTGRKKSDPLGEMTVCEFVSARGQSAAGSRFGDYSQMTVDPVDGKTFWFTGEYMGSGGDWETRIFSFELGRDSIDLGLVKVTAPQSSSFLGNAEDVTIKVENRGAFAVEDFQVSYNFQGQQVGPIDINMPLASGESFDYTFTEQIDVSLAGPYEILTVVKTIDDNYIQNDSLTYCFTKYGQNDAGVINLEVDEFVCADSTIVRFDIQNFTEVPLTSTEVTIILNGNIEAVIPWSGSLSFEETFGLEIPISNLINGSNEIEVYTSAPNGNMDETLSNDAASITIEAITDAVEFFLELQLDFYPGETSWTVVNENNVEIASGGNYGAAELITESLCIDPDRCYTFTIFDSYGDGLIGNGPNSEGYYQIINNDGQTIASIMNLNFGSEESNDFCGIFECNVTADIDVLPESEIGGLDGVINITAQNALAPIQYSIDGGATTQGSAMFSSLSSGDYNVWISDANDCVYEEVINIAACEIDFTSELTPAANSNSLDGSIEVTITGGTPPFQYSSDGGFSFQSSNFFAGLPTGSYDVVIRDALGCEREETIELASLVSTSTTYIGTDVTIYPNPTNGLFHLEVKTSNVSKNTLEYEIIDATGKLILNNRIGRYNGFYLGQISILTKPAGIYYIRFVDSELNQLVKLIKK